MQEEILIFSLLEPTGTFFADRPVCLLRLSKVYG